jgi:hypothetical protein
VENYAHELTNPNGWDYADAGATTFEEFFKNLGEQQALAAQGKITNSAAALA